MVKTVTQGVQTAWARGQNRDPDSNKITHTYVSWNIETGHNVPIHAKAVVEKEYNSCVAGWDAFMESIKKDRDSRPPPTWDHWTRDIKYTDDHKLVDCDYCKEWIHA